MLIAQISDTLITPKGELLYGRLDSSVNLALVVRQIFQLDTLPDCVLLTGDLGFSVLEPFAERFPDRFFNVGVAEQNMVGLASGLAEAGFRPQAMVDHGCLT